MSVKEFVTAGKPKLAAFIIGGLILGGWTVAQHVSAADKPPVAEAGAAFVVSGGATPVLLESSTGQTWTLAKSQAGDSAWLPVKRLTSTSEVENWFAREMSFKKQAQEQALQRADIEAELRRRAVKD